MEANILPIADPVSSHMRSSSTISAFSPHDAILPEREKIWGSLPCTTHTPSSIRNTKSSQELEAITCIVA
ncbi:hypothetical protein HBI25_062790 [Parastagonospora nodorum]|nr:hypothetical protein HBI10_167340 [Parastagonospora nodorum]KAH4015674.1 hypothetical protein HBI13_156930 [Parastagonospora nodorum]KAH4023902.1 hypothetical protein HBI09_165650 [Parastagonospora nodorum]KAH4069875.1 hypothetical protein HBH50_105640 [Parastagonospora nodorum]KAH4090282.1 hypothetical protein HBH48_109410 [Parastagonospora nodorum]